jgi:RNA polymerase sigma-70 factor (ECF subfamily)
VLDAGPGLTYDPLPSQEKMMAEDARGRATDRLWSDLPDLLAAAESNQEARDRVITLLYPELKRIAEAHMRRERRDHTWQATALVSEFFVNMTRARAFTARTKAQFLVVASIAMRRLLVDYARTRNATKRGSGLIRVDIDSADPSDVAHLDDLLTIDDLLTRLAVDDPRMAQIVELRFFGGLSNGEIAEVLGVHERTVKRDWQMARAWLYTQLRREDPQ